MMPPPDPQLAAGDRVLWNGRRRGTVKRLLPDGWVEVVETEIFGRPTRWSLSRAILTRLPKDSI
jgi:hypothetical protein